MYRNIKIQLIYDKIIKTHENWIQKLEGISNRESSW